MVAMRMGGVVLVNLVLYAVYFSPSGNIVWLTAVLSWFEIAVMSCKLDCEFKKFLVVKLTLASFRR